MNQPAAKIPSELPNYPIPLHKVAEATGGIYKVSTVRARIRAHIDKHGDLPSWCADVATGQARASYVVNLRQYADELIPAIQVVTPPKHSLCRQVSKSNPGP